MRTVFFSPHAGIWVHSFPEALIADALRTSGHDVIYVTCDGALSSMCVTMSAHGLNTDSPQPDKAAVCTRCRTDRDLLRSGFGFAGYNFDSVLGDDRLSEAERLVDTSSPRSLAELEIDGVQVGRAALYEYLIQNKRTDLTLSEAEWPRFRPRLVNTVRSLLAATTILDRERPDRVLTYNSLYSVNAMWRGVAEQRGIPSYFLHAGVGLKSRLETMIVGRGSTLQWARELVAAWPSYRNLPCSPTELDAVSAHFEQLFLGRSLFAYSAAKAQNSQDVRSRFGVRSGQKLVVVSMSSYDEYIAAQAIGEMPAMSAQLFPTQIEWIRALLTWVSKRDDVTLVIRVHPREFPNKRESLKSDHARQLEKELTHLPANAKVNWPADQLSIYDLAEEADVFLNAWSTAGREMALLGLPVVVYGPDLLLYPADLNYSGTTLAEYFGAIDHALVDGWSFERVRSAFRWCVLELRRGIVDIDDAFSYSEEPAQTFLTKVWRAVLDGTSLRKRGDLLLRPERLRAQSRITDTVDNVRSTVLPPYAYSDTDERDETTALRLQVSRLARTFSPNSQLHRRLAACAPTLNPLE